MLAALLLRRVKFSSFSRLAPQDQAEWRLLHEDKHTLSAVEHGTRLSYKLRSCTSVEEEVEKANGYFSFETKRKRKSAEETKMIEIEEIAFSPEMLRQMTRLCKAAYTPELYNDDVNHNGRHCSPTLCPDLRTSHCFTGRDHVNHRGLFKSKISLFAALTTDQPLDGNAVIFENPAHQLVGSKNASEQNYTNPASSHQFVVTFKGTKSSANVVTDLKTAQFEYPFMDYNRGRCKLKPRLNGCPIDEQPAMYVHKGFYELLHSNAWRLMGQKHNDRKYATFGCPSSEEMHSPTHNDDEEDGYSYASYFKSRKPESEALHRILESKLFPRIAATKMADMCKDDRASALDKMSDIDRVHVQEALAEIENEPTMKEGTRKIELIFAGHSLGGALALLMAFEVSCYLGQSRSAVINGKLRDKMENILRRVSSDEVEDLVVAHLCKWNGIEFHLRCLTVGQPRIGCRVMADQIDKHLRDYWRITNEGDPVPMIPGRFNLTHRIPRLYLGNRRYSHAGRNAHLKFGGQVVFDPKHFEKGMYVMDTHHGITYEEFTEQYLKHRRKWLWSKALRIVLFVIRLRKEMAQKYGPAVQGSAAEEPVEALSYQYSNTDFDRLQQTLKTSAAPESLEVVVDH